jgi:hypothetical protein
MGKRKDHPPMPNLTLHGSAQSSGNTAVVESGTKLLLLRLKTGDLRSRGYPSKSRQKINRGVQLRGRSATVFPVRLRRWRARPGLRRVFVAAQEFVSFNLGYHSDAAGLVGFGALDTPEATNFYRTSKCDFMGQRK